MFLRAIILVFLLLLTGCQRPMFYHEQAYVFGTLVEIAIIGKSEEEARKATKVAMDELNRIHNKFHAWQDSELTRLNEAIAAGESASVDAELVGVLQDAQQLAQETGQLFNPAIGHLINLWGFQSEQFAEQLPLQTDIEEWRATQPSLNDLQIDGLQVSSKNKAVKIDLGGYAKGYALDRVVEKLHQQGINNALINIGGNILALGQHDDRPWRVGIQHPRQAGALAILSLKDGEAVGTSGDYQRYFMVDGQRYCHLINPIIGYPQNQVQAVTIVLRGKRAGVLSDVLSKPLFISGSSGWQQKAKLLGVSDVLLVNQQGGVEVSSNLFKRLEWVNKPTDINVVPE